MKADLIIENARILTMDADTPRAEALAVAGGKILALGRRDEVDAHAGPGTRRIDAQGSTVLPGFVEAHLHLFSGAQGLSQLQLSDVSGLEELTPKLRSYAAQNPDEGLLVCKAAGYDMFGDGVSTTRQMLDQALPDRPAIFVAPDHHTAWANTIALERAGILHGAEMPVGAEVVMAPDGTATGELQEAPAYGRILALRSSGGREDLGFTGTEPGSLTAAERNADLDTFRKGLNYCASFGFTSLHNMDGNFYQLDLLQELENNGELISRVEVPFHLTPEKPISSIEEALEMRRKYASSRLRSGRIKMFMDGVIDSGTAVMLDDYVGRPGWKGDPLHDAERFEKICVEADRHGLQISVHAIGDGAVSRVLDGYAAARLANGPRDSRHRIEHLELVDPNDIPRLRDLGVVASMQPSHPPGALDFPLEPWLGNIGASRWPNAFPVAAIRDLGVPITFASDWPVADINPMRSIAAAMTRGKYSDACPDNRMTLDQALHSYTVGGAYVGFDEHRLGRLAPGLLADIVILNRDIEQLDAEEIASTTAAMTFSEGVEIWSS